ncbi:Ubiquitin-conjugating_enzyme [Hexamita inflata]|uniref:Ubiquitin-conjugating enzyme n=1 Tax=Hexamita inflata TaxID=28002 RepID=A0AA86QRG2_9EUKA|nr:Ubiquitin-conjugating enzyme [Hexamita inflata]
MNQINALDRLKNERKLLKQDLPPGFTAKPVPLKIGSEVSKTEMNYFVWICGIPGKEKTLWEGSTLTLYLFFPPNYPRDPPKCQFEQMLPHPNIYPSGSVCLSLINPQQGWKPQITIKDVLVGIQMLLNEPNLDSPAQQDAFDTLKRNRKLYEDNIVNFCKQHRTETFNERLMTLIKSGTYRTEPKGAPKVVQQAVVDV